MAKIRPNERDVIVQALRAGVVPGIGLQHVQVGRASEVQEMVRDIERVENGRATARFIIGEYGSGKTFFLSLTKLIAMQKGLVVASADLSPTRRLHGGNGQARALYAELMQKLSTRTKTQGGALPSIVERFISEARRQGKNDKTVVEREIHTRLGELQQLVSGYDFALVVQRYWEAFEEGDDQMKAAALRWLRGEYELKSQAREALGVRTIIDDDSVYDYLKLMAKFTTLAGYKGLMVFLDEMVNLFKLTHSGSRAKNYEQILHVVNDVHDGRVGHLGILFGGTPDFLMDSRRGLYSYEALRSRLAENTFAQNGLVDLSGPVIRLQSLTPNELYVLLVNLRHVYAGGNDKDYLVPDEALEVFLTHCAERIGDAYFRTPRNTIKAFLDLLAILDQNPAADWQQLIGNTQIEEDKPEPTDIEAVEDEGEGLKEFRL